jgi:hypothetical protein
MTRTARSRLEDGLNGVPQGARFSGARISLDFQSSVQETKGRRCNVAEIALRSCHLRGQGESSTRAADDTSCWTVLISCSVGSRAVR